MYFRKKKSGKWIVEIKKVGYPRFAKTFEDLKVGKKWGRKIEQEIETGQFEDLTIKYPYTATAIFFYLFRLVITFFYRYSSLTCYCKKLPRFIEL